MRATRASGASPATRSTSSTSASAAASARAPAPGVAAACRATTNSYELVGRFYRAWDISRVSLELGLDLGAALFDQRFETAGYAPNRVTVAPLLAPRFGVGLDLGAGFFGALDASCATYLLRTQAPHEASAFGAHFALRSSLAIGKRL